MPSFDIVSQVNSMEIENAVNQAKKELANRFDFKGSVGRPGAFMASVHGGERCLGSASRETEAPRADETRRGGSADPCTSRQG